MTQRGFTLLEVLVATTIMAVAIVGLLSGLSTSMNNASRLTDYDRASLLARRKMDELLLSPRLPPGVILEGPFENAPGGWRARVTPFEAAPGSGPGSPILERIELEIWWMNGKQRRNFTLESFRKGVQMAVEAQ